MNDPRLQQMKAIEAALTANVGGVQNAHPWIKPMWLEIQRLRKELGQQKETEQPLKTATELLKEKKEATKAPEKKAPRRAKKTDTDEG